MYPAIFARTYPVQPLDQLLNEISSDGYQGMQFNLSCLGLDSLPASVEEAQLEQLRDATRERTLAISALSGTYNMAHPDAAVRKASRARFETVMAAARKIGAPIVTVCTGSRNPNDMWAAHPDNATAAAWADMRTELEAALKLAAKHDLKIGIEPEPGNVVADARLARRILDELKDPRLGIVLDAANLVGARLPEQATIMAQAADLLGGKIILVHAKDVEADGKVVAAGAGAVDLTRFLRLVLNSGFDGAVVAHGFQHQDTKPSAQFLHTLLREAA